MTYYIADIRDYKGRLTIVWRSKRVMLELLPAVKHAWGILDVAFWGSPVEITHYHPDGKLVDEYNSEELSYFASMQTVHEVIGNYLSYSVDEDRLLSTTWPRSFPASLLPGKDDDGPHAT